MTTAKHDYKWQLLGTVAGCHKWYNGIRPDGRRGVAVADYSGHYPDDTDDGVLWLATGPFVVADERLMPGFHPSNISVDIVLEDNDGKQTLLGGTNLQEALFLDAKGLLTVLYPEHPPANHLHS